MGEVDRQTGVPFQLLVILHLGTIVQRQAAFQVFRQRGKQLFRAEPELFFSGLRYVSDKGVTALPFDERHKVAAIAFAADGVAFPVAVEQTLVYGFRSHVNRAFLL